jgi:beta-glucosidase
MKIKLTRLSLLIFSCFAIMAFMPGSESSKKPIYLNTAYSFKERAADLVSRMNPEEKQSQLGNTMPPIPRLGIKKYDVWGEALHGVMGRNNNSGMTATSFPNSVAVGSTWDPELIKRETSVIADEARGFNHDLIFTLTYWSPVIEPTRDPRWGRTAETFGEDPFLVSQIGGGFVRGLMGDDPTYLKAVPCGKHYFANNTEFNRHTGSADMDDRDMREFYLFPYKTLIQKDKLPAIMTAYSAVNGVPMSASKFLVDSIAKKTYGLDGYVTGDCDAISDILTGHHYAKNNAEATKMGLNSGVDTDCGGVFQSSALEALKQGLITEADMDKALVNIYAIRMRLGEFDPQNIVPYAGIKSSIINDPSHNDLAIEIATKTPVLLKNEMVSKTGKKALPLNASSLKKIAVLGTQADKVELGDYSGEAEAKYRITPLLGIKNYMEQNGLKAEIVSKAGGNTARRTDFFNMISFTTVTKGGVKEYDATKFDDSAKGLITGIMGYRVGQNAIKGIKDGDWTLYNNVDITNVDSIRFNMSVSGDGGLLEVRVGSKTGNILASQKIAGAAQQGRGGGGFGRTKIVPVKINTLGISGPQSIVLVYHEAEVPATDKETLDMAASSDVAVIFVGTDQTTGREESDRYSLALPGNQNELIKAVAAVNPNTIVVIQGMGMVEVEQLKNNPNVAGIIFTGYNGQAQGAAMAKILFGDVNPGGKTSLTWYKSVNDLPDFADYNLRGGAGKNGRTYQYFTKDVSYEFGYGLSYTTFGYSNFAINKSAITPNDKVTVKVDVKNTGSVDGDEVVQVYVKTPDSQASLERPIKRLKGFKRVTIPAGQTKTVSINIDCADLWFWDTKNKRIMFDQGKYVFEIGASSKDIKGQVEAKMSGSYTPELKTVVAECGKVVLKSGNTVQTSVSASMSDDSFYNIKNAQVIYKSTNTAVASVDEKGLVTAKGVGTALIFAEVTVNGKTVTNSYPLKVMPDLNPASITVNGKNIPGLVPEVKGYSYLLASGATAPTVGATAAGTNVSVDVAQAKGVPGNATVTLTDNITIEKNLYLVNFGAQSVSDEFNGGTLGKQWSWVRENSATWSLAKKSGSLLITSEKGDIVSTNNNAKNLLLQSANADWTIESKMVCSRKPSGQTQHAGVLAYQDDENFVKLVYRASNARRGFGGPTTPTVVPGSVELVIESNGYQKSVATLSLADIIKDDKTLVLKLERKGNIYTASVSADGKKYKTVGAADIILTDVKTGMIVCDGVPQAGRGGNFPGMQEPANQPEIPFEAAFDYFHIVSKGLK